MCQCNDCTCTCAYHCTFFEALPRYTIDQLLHTTDNMAKTNFLGQGGFGSVYMGKVRHTMVAVKFFKDVSVTFVYAGRLCFLGKRTCIYVYSEPFCKCTLLSACIVQLEWLIRMQFVTCYLCKHYTEIWNCVRTAGNADYRSIHFVPVSIILTYCTVTCLCMVTRSNYCSHTWTTEATHTRILYRLWVFAATRNTRQSCTNLWRRVHYQRYFLDLTRYLCVCDVKCWDMKLFLDYCRDVQLLTFKPDSVSYAKRLLV